ncbi:hypothetical protein ACWGDE_16750 [Streptomyces sp. NPDC054956]
MSELPWESYSRTRLRRGWAYPVGRSVIEAGLRAAGVRVDGLWLSGTDPDNWTEWTILANCGWTPRAGPRRGAGRASLSVSAVPSSERLAISGLLVEEVLPRAYDWLARAAADPDSAWGGSSHWWRARIRNGALTTEEA